jgi:hypothetical protein
MKKLIIVSLNKKHASYTVFDFTLYVNKTTIDYQQLQYLCTRQFCAVGFGHIFVQYSIQYVEINTIILFRQLYKARFDQRFGHE